MSVVLLYWIQCQAAERDATSHEGGTETDEKSR